MNHGEYLRMYQAEDHHWWYVSLHDLLLGQVRGEARRLGRPLDVFDAGCGTGRLWQLLSAERHRVAGCDASEEALRLCRRRGVAGARRADLNAIELEPGSLDVVTAIDVLYHAGVADDVAVMRRLARGLRPGGVLIVHLVAHEFLRGPHDVAVHTRERYTRAMVLDRLRAAGLHPERVTYRVSLVFPLIAAYRLWSGRARRARARPEDVISDVSMPGPLANRLLRWAGRLEGWLTRWVALPFGSSILAVARQPAPPDGPGPGRP